MPAPSAAFRTCHFTCTCSLQNDDHSDMCRPDVLAVIEQAPQEAATGLEPPPVIQPESVTPAALPQSRPVEEQQSGPEPVASHAAVGSSALREDAPVAAVAGFQETEARDASMAVAGQTMRRPVIVEQPRRASAEEHAMEQSAQPASTHAACEPSCAPRSSGAPARQPIDAGVGPVALQPQRLSVEEATPLPAGDEGPSTVDSVQPPEDAPNQDIREWFGSVKTQPGSRITAAADASPGAAAVLPRFVLSPTTGVFRAVDPSPASPMSDVGAQDRPALWQQLATSALSSDQRGASSLAPPAQQRSSEGRSLPASGSATAPKQAATFSQQEQAHQWAPDPQISMPKGLNSVRASREGRLQMATPGSAAANGEAKLAIGGSLGDISPVEPAEGAGKLPATPVSFDDAEVSIHATVGSSSILWPCLP